jgi:hypothetical protein
MSLFHLQSSCGGSEKDLARSAHGQALGDGSASSAALHTLEHPVHAAEIKLAMGKKSLVCSVRCVILDLLACKYGAQIAPKRLAITRGDDETVLG